MDTQELKSLAAEELAHARTLTWRELSRLVPWGDTYRGFSPSGAEVEFERNYLWAGHEHGDAILCEVTVRCLPEREDCEAIATCLIERTTADAPKG